MLVGHQGWTQTSSAHPSQTVERSCCGSSESVFRPRWFELRPVWGAKLLQSIIEMSTSSAGLSVRWILPLLNHTVLSFNLIGPPAGNYFATLRLRAY